MAGADGVRYFTFCEARYNWCPSRALFVRALALPDSAAQRSALSSDLRFITCGQIEERAVLLQSTVSKLVWFRFVAATWLARRCTLSRAA